MAKMIYDTLKLLMSGMESGTVLSSLSIQKQNRSIRNRLRI